MSYVATATAGGPVISLMGDGGLGMTMSEISTVVEHRIHTVAVMMKKTCRGTERAYPRDFFNGLYIGANVNSPAFNQLAELYGARSFRADTLGQMAEAIEAALACGKPAIVDGAVDPTAPYSFRRDSFKHRIG